MRCSTCGEFLTPGQARCPTCDTAIPRQRTQSPIRWPARHVDPGLHQCPRCGNYGSGVSYFSRAGNIGLLVGVSLFTYGIGGMVYWVVRRKHRVCPNCGLSWEKVVQAGIRPLEAPDDEPALPREREQELLPSAGVKRRLLGTVMILFATFMILMGIVELEAAMVVIGSVAGAGGCGAFYWGWRGQQTRRQALMSGLQRKVLRLATRKGGVLTVTEVAADLNVSLTVAEKLMVQMDDGFRVRSDITSEGVIIYEFPEVQHRGSLKPADLGPAEERPTHGDASAGS